MDSTVSVSKGVFVFPNGFSKAKNNKKKSGHTLFEKLFRTEVWYTTYKRNWDFIENELKELHHRTYSMLLNDVVSYVLQSYGDNDMSMLKGVIPSATLLTGISQPDHISQFSALIYMIRNEVTPHVAIVNSQDASSLKHLVENSVWQLINGQDALDIVDDDVIHSKYKIKKNQCSMKTLKSWYNSKYSTGSPKKKQAVVKNSLVIIIPDFESFNCNVLQDFVMIVSSYVPSLPIAFVFGVATSVSALHKSFPYHVSSKLLIRVFHTHSSPVYMNQVLEDIFLTHTSPFHLSGKAFELLTDVFLFYDFSVTGLIQSIKSLSPTDISPTEPFIYVTFHDRPFSYRIFHRHNDKPITLLTTDLSMYGKFAVHGKYCMMEHYYGDNLKSLGCDKDRIEEAIINLNSEDLENIRRLPSFRPFVERQDCKTKIKLFEEDSFLREALYKEMNRLHDYLYGFYLCARLLAVYVKDMPRNVIGKSLREIYTKCATECITKTPEFKECMQLLNFQSQVKLVESIKTSLKVVNCYLQSASPAKPLRSTPSKNNMNDALSNSDLGDSFAKTIRVHLLTFLRHIENANTETTVITNKADIEEEIENTPGNRYKLKEKLLKATRADKIQSEFEMVRSRFVSYLEEMFTKGLEPPHTRTFHEVLFFSDVASVKKQIVGSPRGALHTALSNPAHYLQCTCCHLQSPDSVVDTLPDVCLAYKLHRECGKHINLYDWLQAYAAVLKPDEDDETRHQDATIQLRFTRAVAELQFLGFIKSSKRKTDHVMRLTW